MSVDSMFVHKMWVDKELSKMVTVKTVPFPMLSDGGGNIGKIYGVYDEENGVDIRGRFLIDPDGVVQAYEMVAPPVGRNIHETLRQVQAFRLVRDGKGTKRRLRDGNPAKRFWNPDPIWWAMSGKCGP